MEDDRSVHDAEVMESGYDYAKFDEVLEKSKEYLFKLNSEKRLKIIKKLLKNPNFDDTDVYYLCEREFQKPTYKPPAVQPEERPCVVEHKEPLKIRFVMSGREPIAEQKHKSEKMGSKRPRESESDWDFSDEEEKGGAKKRANKKKTKKVHDVDIVAHENTSELPAEFKEQIQNLGGSNAVLVLKKKLFNTDVNPNNGRLSLPCKQIKDMSFLREEEKAFLATREIGKGVPQINSMIIGENGSEHGISIRQWDMTRSLVYNLVTGWNDVVKYHSLCADMTVELWSFRVEGNLWFALVKL